MKNPKLYKIISALFAALLLIGGMGDVLPQGLNKEVFISGCMVITVISSAFETYFNPMLSNKVLWLQALGAAGFTAGGLLDHFNVFHFGPIMTEWIRFGLVLTWKVSDYLYKEFQTI